VSAEAALYSEFVERLLYFETCQDVRAVAQQIKGEPSAFRAALLAKEKTAERSGLAHTAALIRFIRTELGDWLAEPPSPDTSDTRQLLDAAKAAPSALRALTLLRGHAHLVTSELLEVAETEIEGRGRDVSAPDARVLWCIALVLDDAKAGMRARLWWTSAQQNLGQFRQAKRHLRRAVNEAGSLGDRSQLMALAAQVSFFRETHDLPRAIEALNRCLSLRTETQTTVELLGMLAVCYRESGQPARAGECATNGLQLAESLSDDKSVVFLLKLRGLCHEDLGRYEKGNQDYTRAATLAERAGDRRQQFEALSNAAFSLGKRGLPQESYRAFDALLRQAERWGNPGMLASTHHNIGAVLLEMNRYAEAREHYQHALQRDDRLEGKVISYRGLGDVCFGLQDYEQARRLYTFSIMLAMQSGDLAELVLIQQRLVRREMREDKPIADDDVRQLKSVRDRLRARSRITYDIAATRLLATLYEENGDTASALGELDELLRSGRALDTSDMLMIQVDRARLVANNPEGWSEGFALFENLLGIVDRRLRETVFDVRRGEIIGEMVTIYEALLALLADSRAPMAWKGIAREDLAFDLHEAAKSRSTLVSLADAPIEPPADVPEHLCRAEMNLLNRQRALKGDGVDGTGAWSEDDLVETGRQLAACREQMRPHAPAYVRYRAGEPYRYAEVVTWLRETSDMPTAVLSLFSDKDAVTAFIVRTDRAHPDMLRLPLTREAISGTAHALGRTFNGNPKEFPPYPPIRGDAPFRRTLGCLDELSRAFQPVWQALDGMEVVSVAPHGPLHLVPLHALRVNGSYAAERHALVYTPSVSVLLQIAARRHAEQPRERPRVLAAGVSASEDAHPEYFEQEADLFEPTAWDMTEAFGIERASRARVLGEVHDQDVVHLSCHGFFDERDPLRSGVVLSNGRIKAPRDLSQISVLERKAFTLTADDLMRAGLAADVVTLSACSTGLQSVRNDGDELDGFSRAILSAGASTALLAMWNVDQESSREFFRTFYRQYRLHGRGAKWRALHAAQREFLHSAREAWRHPYHWAPYFMIGDWRSA
jgi:tetratricopeptide (TPR) repeat protein